MVQSQIKQKKKFILITEFKVELNFHYRRKREHLKKI